MKRFIIFITSLFIAACNNGGVGSANNATVQPSENTPALTKKIHGLPNLGNSCYMNAAVQIVINNPILRQEVLSRNANSKFFSLFNAYDNNDINNLIINHQNVANYIYSLPGIPPKGQPGASIDVLSGDKLSFNGLNLSSEVIDSSSVNSLNNSILSFLKSGIYLFSFQNSINYNTTIQYNEIPFKDRAVGFTYNSGGHYISFLKLDNQWYSVNDSMVSTVTENDLNNLSQGLTTGIEVVSYM